MGSCTEFHVKRAQRETPRRPRSRPWPWRRDERSEAQLKGCLYLMDPKQPENGHCVPLVARVRQTFIRCESKSPRVSEGRKNLIAIPTLVAVGHLATMLNRVHVERNWLRKEMQLLPHRGE